MSEESSGGYGAITGADLGPVLVSMPLTKSLYDYFYRALDLGVLEGALGEFDVSEDLLPLIKAIHHVLAGGAVSVTIDRKGNSDIVKELNRMREKGRDDSNFINKESGYYATPGI